MPHDDDEPWREPEPTFERPTGLGACAHAATARELRFRVQAPNSAPRDSSVVALDAGAARMIAAIAEAPWAGARFLRLAARQPEVGAVLLEGPGGEAVPAAEEVAGRDLVVMVATSAEGARAAEALGRLARARGVMTAGVVVAGPRTEEVAGALRPSAAVLVTAADEDYLPAMLSALRA